MTKIDIDDMKQNMSYEGYTANEPFICQMWEIIYEMTDEE